jgi:oxygen-dependent protoporphyrinogen oxidase
MIAVVGGGITGLALGWELDRLGAEFVVLEASERAGGVIRSGEVEGRVLDWGPQRLRLTRKLGDLLAALGLRDELITAPADLPLHVYARGRLRRAPFSLGAFLATDALSLAAKARVVLEPFTAGARAEETVAECFTRKLGREFYEMLAGPLYGGLYASDPADMEVGLSLMHTLRELGVGRSFALRFIGSGGRVSPPPACSFRAGMETLPKALARGLGGRLRLHAPVRGIRRAGRCWSVEVDGDRIEAESVVLTTPAPVTASLLESAEPPTAAALRELRYNPLAVVHLEAQTPLRGMGFQVALSERRLALRGVTFNDSLFARRHLQTAFLGGAFHREVEHMDREELAARAVSELRTCTGADARVLAVEHVRMPAWDRSWRSLQRVDLPAGLHVAANWWSRPGLAGRFAEAERTARVLTGSGTRAG